MLVLSRKNNERITIGSDPATQVVITVVEIRGNTVRIGVEASPRMPILRDDAVITVPRNKIPGA